MMDRELLLANIRKSLASISVPRFFETERGFQGALLAELTRRIPKYVLPDGAIIEQEYQKRLAEHGLTIRPDIIIHEPFDPNRHADQREGNLAVLELKLRASKDEAAEDYKSLSKMIEVLRYPLGLFINIASDATYVELIPRGAKTHIVAFAVSLREGHVRVVED